MDRREVLWIVLLLVAGAAGLWTFLHFYTEAFPAASLDFRLSREEAFQKAQDYLAELGYDMEGYESAQVFSRNAMQQIFLEQTVGLEETNRLAREWVSIWTWNVRWFKPLQKEEFRVQLDPGGRIVSFEHRILESDEGAGLAQDRALPIAERFVRETQGFNLDEYDLIEQSSQERKARVDHTFTYRKQGFKVGEDGHYRLEAVVQGDRVGRFREYLKVPESFSRNYSEVRSRAGLLTGVFSVFWAALGIAMLVFLVRFYRRGALRWQAGLVVGILVAIATAAAIVNSLPLMRYGFDTTQSTGAFLVIMLVGAVLGAIFSGGIICMVGASGNALGREVLFEDRRSPLGRLSLKGIFSKGFLRSTFAGYGIAGCMLGYVTAFYLVGSRYFGVWAPADVSQYDNAFSTAIPWIYPLLVGLSASTMEEFFFRLLAISLLVLWLKRRWLAVLIPAIVWAFLHSNYPVEPIYTRGIELTVVGIAFGLAFLRYGIWAPIIAHYAYNAFLTAFPMMKSSSLYFQTSGIAVTGILLLPAIPALIAVLAGRAPEIEGEEEETPEPPAQVPEPEAAPVEAVAQKAPEAYLPDARGWAIAGAFAILGIALAVGFRTERFGERTLSMSVTRARAVEAAEAFCSEVGLDIADYRRTAQFRSSVGSDHFIHLVRNAGVARADTLAFEDATPWLWNVRWFKPLEKEEIRVGIDAATGQVAYFNHMLPEAQAGAELAPDSARAIAERFVVRRFGRTVTDTARYKLLEAREDKQEARLDHHFVWERIDRKVEDGEFRVNVRVQGGEPGYFSLSYKAPEVFLRELRERKTRDVIAGLWPMLIGLGTLVLGGIYFFRSYREGRVSWRFPIWIGALIVALRLIEKVNGLPTFFQSYDTQQAMATFLGLQAVGLLTSTVFAGLAFAVALALMLALYRSLYPEEIAPDRWVGLLRLREGGARFWAGTLALAAAFALFRMGSGSFSLYVNYHWFTEHLKPGDYTLPRVNTYLPFLDGLTDGVSDFLGPLILLALLLVWKQALNRAWIIVAGLAVTTLATQVAPAENFRHYAILAGMGLANLALLLFLIVRVIRFNLMVYMVALWSSELILGPGITFFQKTTDAAYQASGVIMLALGFAPLLLPLIAHLRARKASPQPASP